MLCLLNLEHETMLLGREKAGVGKTMMMNLNRWPRIDCSFRRLFPDLSPALFQSPCVLGKRMQISLLSAVVT